MRSTAHIALAEVVSTVPTPGGKFFVELFQHGSLAVELYAPRGTDRQQPHTRDEVYVVARGRGWFFDGTRRVPVAPGDFLFVAAQIPHRFEEFTDDFAAWVFFYGPEGGEESPER
jgi:mannose-6-phosphate isomerase-like protein (cupin superfamily)